MRFPYRYTVPAVAVSVALASCAYAPKLDQDPAGMAGIRAQYLADHPDGRFTEQVLRGELARGMGRIDVFAAWGTPDARRRDGELAGELWTYFRRDDVTKDSILWELTFEDRTLVRWNMSRSTSMLGVVTIPNLSAATVDRPGDGLGGGPFAGSSMKGRLR